MKRARGFKKITPTDSSKEKEKINLDDEFATVKTDEVFSNVVMPPLKTSHHPSVPCVPVRSDEMVDLNPFPYLYKSTYDFKFDNIKQRILDDINKTKSVVEQTGIITPEKEGGYTTVLLNNASVNGKMWSPPHTWPEFFNFTNIWLPQKIKQIWKFWNLSEFSVPFISGSWINEHSYGSYTEGHHHQNSQISLSCYLNVPKDSGRFMLKDPMEIYNYSRPMNHNHEQVGGSWKYIGVDTNDVIFFPGFIQHQTERSESNEKRYIMSINVDHIHAAAFEHFKDKTIFKPLWQPNYTSLGPSLVDER